MHTYIFKDVFISIADKVKESQKKNPETNLYRVKNLDNSAEFTCMHTCMYECIKKDFFFLIVLLLSENLSEKLDGVKNLEESILYRCRNNSGRCMGRPSESNQPNWRRERRRRRREGGKEGGRRNCVCCWPYKVQNWSCRWYVSAERGKSQTRRFLSYQPNRHHQLHSTRSSILHSMIILFIWLRWLSRLFLVALITCMPFAYPERLLFIIGVWMLIPRSLLILFDWLYLLLGLLLLWCIRNSLFAIPTVDAVDLDLFSWLSLLLNYGLAVINLQSSLVCFPWFVVWN